MLKEIKYVSVQCISFFRNAARLLNRTSRAAALAYVIERFEAWLHGANRIERDRVRNAVAARAYVIERFRAWLHGAY